MNDDPCKITKITSSKIIVKFKKPQFAVAPGQSIVFYNQDECLGGAIIDKTYN